ncbi:hypothetical protein M5C97_24450 [Acidovorax sp. NCPPB 3859]|nr:MULTISPECIES: hypothetical protein [unclassified Acidovorax]MDA8452929.1 hypothetical protein [Acidovorax sp. GBBC 3297]MDA8462337.1 hypothetical protein [Acidovorax sp. GBBC 3333]MDA8467371.1 hypothetical protein [Acidovorax sp. GBBC 3332]MDA8472411.1 hypothetical protein [Acidovorax sp. GBBC 3299]WCM78593.1 hypothetical protein M5C94_24400 [Acidovorax sp. GBBC 712]
MNFSQFKKIPCIVWCMALNALVIIVWYAATPTFFDSENSPHRVYRLEFHKASLLQRIAHPTFKMPYVVRLYKIEPKTLLGESEVVDLWLNGEITWYLNSSVERNEVRVGRDVVFEKVLPECTPASPLVSCSKSR